MKSTSSLRLKQKAFWAMFSLVVPMGVSQAQTPLYKDVEMPLENRLADLMARLTLDEKITMLAGTGMTTQPIPRLQIPEMGMVDGGQGVKGGPAGTLGPATAFPSPVAMAATWNTPLIGRVGAAIGVEVLNKGVGAQMLLGPAVNIHRSPLGGRNAEYFTEDPFLASRLSVGYIRGLQSTGALACIKHFSANNQETNRMSINAIVSERALREIYWPAFEAGVKEGDVAAVMTAYNRINGPYSSASPYVVTDVLNKGWNFNGVVMSDWGGVHDTVRTINAGNDLEMPSPSFLSPEKVKVALERGLVTTEQIDQNVRRIMRTVLRSGVVDGPRVAQNALVNSRAHSDIALQTAQEGIVLLKNQRQILPLDATKLRSIALVGPAVEKFQIVGGGSPEVSPLREVGPLEAIKARLGAGVTVRATTGLLDGDAFPVGTLMVPNSSNAGLRAEYFTNKNLEGAPALTRSETQIDLNSAPAGFGPNDWSARWTTTLTPLKSGPTTFYLRADDGCRLFIDDKPVIDHWVASSATVQRATINLTAGQKYELRAEYFQSGGDMAAQLKWSPPGTQPFLEAVKLARQSEVAVVFVTTRGSEAEGMDRPTMDLPDNQDELIRQVAAVNKRTIVVLNNGTPVTMNWLSSIPAIVEVWLPGQQGGTALSQVLFGDINPSGHLPTTFGAHREDYPDYPNFPGKNGIATYAEGIYVGYRGFDKRKIAPLFPFGYGLSYTNFRIDKLKLSSPTLIAGGALSASVRVTNMGKRAGAQVVQLYIHDPNPKIDKPLRELKGFSKVMLQPGQSQIVTLPLKIRDFAYCDVKAKAWRVDGGNYEIGVGDSSRTLTQRATVKVASYLEPIPFMKDETIMDTTQQGPDLARGKVATASSLEKLEYQPENAVDGDPTTRWSSGFADNQWLAVDLGQTERIGRIHLVWEQAYAMDYRIETSGDGQVWSTAYSTRKGIGETEDITFAPVEARYVRVFAIKRATDSGNSLFSFEVRAPLD